MSEWTSTKLGELISITRGTTYKSLLLDQPGPVLLGLASIQRDGGFRADKLRTYGGDSPEKLLVRPGELYASLKDVTQSGDLLGSVARVPASGPIGRLSQDTVRLDFISDNVDPDFLYMALLSPRYRAWCRQHATGTTNLGLPRDDFRGFEVVHPADRDGQMNVAAVLTTLDALIENNRRRVEVLEEMARAIYREWFVQFRYPGHEDIPLVDSALGPIPEGWALAVADDLLTVVKATVDPTTIDPTTPAVGLEHIPRQQITLDGWGSAGAQGSRKGLFERGDILFGKIRPYFHKVSVAPVDGICSTDAIVIRPHDTHWGQVVAVVSSTDFVANATSTSNGTKMPRADWKVIGQWPVAVPPANVAEAFTAMVRDQLGLAERLMLENRSLAALRDLLLPKLVTGQIDVSSLDLDALLAGPAA